MYTDYRPTPLQHYLFPAGADGLYLVVDEQGELLTNILEAPSQLFAYLHAWSALVEEQRTHNVLPLAGAAHSNSVACIPAVMPLRTPFFAAAFTNTCTL